MGIEDLWKHKGPVDDKRLAEKMAHASDYERSNAAFLRQMLEDLKYSRMDDTFTAKARDFFRKRILGKESLREEEQEHLESIERRSDILEESVYIKETVRREAPSLSDEELESLVKEFYFFLPEKVKREVQFNDLVKFNPNTLKFFEEAVLFDKSLSKEVLLARIAFTELYKVLKLRKAVTHRKIQEGGLKE